MHSKTRVWVEGTVLAALAMVLSFIPLKIGASFSISLGQIALTVFAVRRGVKPGLLAGLIWGLLHFPLGDVYYLSIPQVLIEYILAYLFVGFAGVYAPKIRECVKKGNKKGLKKYLILSGLVGAAARYFWHFVAGWVFWGDYVQWGLSPVVYSLVMNAASGLATGAVAIVALLIIADIYPQLYLPKDVN